MNLQEFLNARAVIKKLITDSNKDIALLNDIDRIDKSKPGNQSVVDCADISLFEFVKNTKALRQIENIIDQCVIIKDEMAEYLLGDHVTTAPCLEETICFIDKYGAGVTDLPIDVNRYKEMVQVLTELNMAHLITSYTSFVTDLERICLENTSPEEVLNLFVCLNPQSADE